MQLCAVAPFTGAWIEIRSLSLLFKSLIVAPFTGAWIEIRHGTKTKLFCFQSLPSRERGLKYRGQKRGDFGSQVAPFTGAWIEISLAMNSSGLK